MSTGHLFNFLSRSSEDEPAPENDPAEEHADAQDDDWSELDWDDAARSELSSLFDEEEADDDAAPDGDATDDLAALREALAQQQDAESGESAGDQTAAEDEAPDDPTPAPTPEPDTMPDGTGPAPDAQPGFPEEREADGPHPVEPTDAPHGDFGGGPDESASATPPQSHSPVDRSDASHSPDASPPDATPAPMGAKDEPPADADAETVQGLREQIEKDPVLAAVLRAGLVRPEQLQAALREHETGTEKPLWRTLAALPDVDREKVFERAAQAKGFDSVAVNENQPAPAFLDTLQGLLPAGTGQRLMKQGLLPVELSMLPSTGSLQLVLATHDPANPDHQSYAADLKVPTVLRYAPEPAVAARINALRANTDDADAGDDDGHAAAPDATEATMPSPDVETAAQHRDSRATTEEEAPASTPQEDAIRKAFQPSADEEPAPGGDDASPPREFPPSLSEHGSNASPSHPEPYPDTQPDADGASLLDIQDGPKEDPKEGSGVPEDDYSDSLPSPEESLSPDELSSAFRDDVFSELDLDLADRMKRSGGDVLSDIFGGQSPLEDDASDGASSDEADVGPPEGPPRSPGNESHEASAPEPPSSPSVNGAAHASGPERPERHEPTDPEVIKALKTNDRVVDALLRQGLISVEQAEEAQRKKDEKGLSDALWRVVAQLSGVERPMVYEEAARVYAFPVADLKQHVPDHEFTRSVMDKFTDKHRDRMLDLGVVPLRAQKEEQRGAVKLFLITYDPMRPEVHRLTRQLELDRVELQYAPEAAINTLISEAFPRKNEYLERIEENGSVDLGQSYEDNEDLVDDEELEAEINRSTLINLFEATLVEAVREGASDIHIYPNANKEVEIHFRIDGRLNHWHTENKVHPEALLSVIKDNSMNVDRFERDAAQDGFIQRWVDNTLIRFRVSVMPIANASQEIKSESIVIRVLDDRKVITDLDKLGLLEGALERFQHAISQPHGMVILTGPTGSGKSTTLVAALHRVISPEVNVLTIEDPVEYIIEDVRQIKLNDKLKLEDALRSILRHDPDVVMVGEMRDRQTAELAIKLANTGHLTFSTLHTNDAPSAISRLYKMGIEPFLIAYAINLVVAQRLIRKLCPACMQVDDDPDPIMLQQLGFTDEEIQNTTFYTEGNDPDCSRCHGLNYKGRRAISEALYFSRPIRHMIVGADGMVDESAIREQAAKDGMLSLRASAREVVKMGETSVREMMRVVASEGKTLA